MGQWDAMHVETISFLQVSTRIWKYLKDSRRNLFEPAIVGSPSTSVKDVATKCETKTIGTFYMPNMSHIWLSIFVIPTRRCPLLNGSWFTNY